MKPLRNVRFAPIFLDANIPVSDGQDIFRFLEHVSQLAGVPVAIVTGQSDMRILVKCLIAGAVDFAVEPLEQAILFKKVRRYLQINDAKDISREI